MSRQAKVWFITGASSGFGRELAEAVLRRADSAVLAARRLDALAEIAKPHAERALAVALDVTSPEQRLAAVAAARERFGRIDVLANIAGRGSLGAVEEFAPEQLREQLDVNFFGPAELTRALLPTLRAQGRGHVLMLTSIGGLISMGGFGAYCASKFALEGWSEALRDEVAPLGIKVTMIEPGGFRTEFAGAVNMRAARPLPDYRPVIEPLERFLYGNDGAQAGDPAKAAELMIEVVDSEAPPFRLMMGADAYAIFGQKSAAKQAEFAQWRAKAEATAFAGTETRSIGG